ncbi:MAG: RcnB family protein [Hyphomonadaceae bacterium]
MKIRSLILAGVAAATMSVSTIGAASAAPPRFDHGYYAVNGHRYERVRGPDWRAPPGYRHHNWQRGARLPNEYRRVVVRDYRAYHLAPPPRGYQYVRVDNDVILASIATGVVASVIANAFYN